MGSLTAYCGINCASCELYIASTGNDEKLKQDVAKRWGEMYNKEFLPEEMFCGGCKSDKTFGLCSRCAIKACNLQRGTDNCSQCERYKCERIIKFFEWQEENETKVEIVI